MRRNILILHNLGDPGRSLRSMVDYLKCFERYAPEHNYLYHRWSEAPTAALRDMDFQLVVLDASALGICRYRPRELYYEIKDRWSFMRDRDAVKIALPQDDYHQSNVLDELFDDWNVDIVYSVLPKQMQMLYPRTGRKAQLKGALTGYIEDDSIAQLAPFARPFRQRAFDVGQRCTMYSPVGGRYASLKGVMAEAFHAEAISRGFASNISTDPADVLLGDDWPRLLGNARFALGAEGGVSLWDPDGLIHDRVRAYLTDHPGAAFEAVEQACFPGEDMAQVFSAVSPRLFEAAMMGCSQILLEGEYLGLLHPFEHYIPVKHDMSDIADAVEAMRDLDGAEKRMRATWDALIEQPQLRYSHFVAGVMADVEDIALRRHLQPANDAAFRIGVATHQKQLMAARAQTGPLDFFLRTRLHRAVPTGIRQYVKAMLGR